MKFQIPATAIVITLAAITAHCEEMPDTLMLTHNPATTVITEKSNGFTVTVINDDSTTTVYQKEFSQNSNIKSRQYDSVFSETIFNEGVIGLKAGSRHWNVITGGIGIGLVYPSGQPSGMGLQWNKSFEISWVNALAVEYVNRGFGVSLGLGFDWRNYKMTIIHRMNLNGEGGIKPDVDPEEVEPRSSRIKVFSLGIPLLISQKFGRSGMGVTAGAILNFNTHASLKTDYRTANGNEIEEYAEGFHHRRITVDLFGCLQFWKSCGLYVRYSPQSVLQGHNSPQFRPLSAGIMLFL